MIGTKLIEELVQSVSISYLIKGNDRVSLLLLAAPENGKTTIAASARNDTASFIAVISGRSVLKEIKEKPTLEYFVFNDMSCIRALSDTATNLLITLLNQITRGEKGSVSFAGGQVEQIEREIGIIGCMPMSVFTDHRAKWKELGFVSRMLPFAYSYSESLTAEIKDAIDAQKVMNGQAYGKLHTRLKRVKKNPIFVSMKETDTLLLRSLADERASQLGQIGIRLLKNYHSLIRAHALLMGRRCVNQDDMKFIWDVDKFVSISACSELKNTSIQEFKMKIKEGV